MPSVEKSLETLQKTTQATHDVVIAGQARDEARDKRLSDLEKTVNGNGQPGVVKRLTVVEESQKHCPARKQVSHAGRANLLTSIALGISGITAAVALYVAMKG
jgi:hypothetical protein